MVNERREASSEELKAWLESRPDIAIEARIGFQQIDRGEYVRYSVDRSLSRRLKSIARHMGHIMIENVKTTIRKSS